VGKPPVRKYCNKCGLVYNENDAWKNGVKDVIIEIIKVYFSSGWINDFGGRFSEKVL
jgi:hypothetical protein